MGPMSSSRVVVSLPSEVLAMLDRERRVSGASRSEFIRSAIEKFMEVGPEQGEPASYIDAYRANPESQDEIDATLAQATRAIAESPWE
jgi:metal-responsive CopG/Arc/MetJ family transcriptional regulator